MLVFGGVTYDLLLIVQPKKEGCIWFTLLSLTPAKMGGFSSGDPLHISPLEIVTLSF